MLSDKMIRYYLDLHMSAASVDERKRYGLGISPALEDDQIQPASIDLRLGSGFVWYPRPVLGPDGSNAALDPSSPNTEWIRQSTEDVAELIITPGMFVLGTTLERVSIPTAIAARVEGKSSLGRLGLMVHATAGFIDPGFDGNITLELYNLNTRGIILRPGMKICQLSFYRVDGPVARPYGHPGLSSKYQGQLGVTPSRAERE